MTLDDRDESYEADAAWPRSAHIGFVVLLFAIIATMVGLPALFVTLDEPRPRVVTDVSREVTGTFVSAADTTFKLYGYGQPQAAFPSGAPVTGAEPRIVVRFKQADDLTRYRLRRLPGVEVPVDRRLVDATTVLLTPREPLDGGRYYVVAPRGGMYEDEATYSYFEARP